ncbi:MAG: DUF433 domain-containing protein [Verrucomicrobiota bacterium]
MNGTSASATAYRYITRQPGVRSGHAIIEGTRIGVHDVIGLLQNAETVDSIVTRYFPKAILSAWSSAENVPAPEPLAFTEFPQGGFKT